MPTDQDKTLAAHWTFVQRILAEYDRCKKAGYDELDARKLASFMGGASVSLNTIEILVKAREEYEDDNR